MWGRPRTVGAGRARLGPTHSLRHTDHYVGPAAHGWGRPHTVGAGRAIVNARRSTSTGSGGRPPHHYDEQMSARPRTSADTPAGAGRAPRRLRADAERNRAAILCAAREVFAEQGLEAPLEEI